MTNPSTLPAVDAALLRVLQALADENRLRILEVLRSGEHCVCELQTSLDMGQSLLSHHLRSLREAGLVKDRREGRWIHYSLSGELLPTLEKYLGSMSADANPGRPREPSCAP